MDKPKCPDCNATLKKFTVTRDWNGRKFHLKCYDRIRTINAWYDLGIKSADTKKEKKRITEEKEKYNAKFKI